METFTLSPGRCWLVRAFGRNPLVRRSDRVQAMLLLFVLISALLAASLAGAVGTAVHDSRGRVYAEESLHRHQVTATVTAEPTPTIRDTRRVSAAPVRWRANGSDHVDTLEVNQDANIGDQQNLWVDDLGNRATAPRPKWQAGFDAVVVGIGSWFGVMLVVAAVSVMVDFEVARRRNRIWDKELRVLLENDGAGSQS